MTVSQAVTQDSGDVSQGTLQLDASDSDNDCKLTFNLSDDDAATDQVDQIWEEHRQLQQLLRTQEQERQVENEKKRHCSKRKLNLTGLNLFMIT